MVSKYLTHNCLHITDKEALDRLHSLFLKKEVSEVPASRYQKSDEEVIEFLRR